MSKIKAMMLGLLASATTLAATMTVELPPGDYLLIPAEPYTIVSIPSTPVEPPVLDTDGDRVNDDMDQCPDTPTGGEVDSTGCTVVSTPTPVGSLANTEIGKFAATLQPGSFSEVLVGTLPPGVTQFNDLFAGERPDGSPAPAIDEWTSANYWDSTKLRTFFIGLRQSHRFLSYHALDNRWEELPLEGVQNAPPRYQQFGHNYERTTLDRNRGHFYLMIGETLYRYLIAGDRWENFEALGFGGQVIEWHADLDMAVNLNNGLLKGWRDGQLFDLGPSVVHGYHSIARYNPVTRDMMMIGGNNSRNTVALLKADGSLVQKSDAPFTVSVKQDDLTYDPVTGNYLVATADRKLWEYSESLDEWRLVFDWVVDDYPLHRYLRNVPVVIDDLGVIAWQIPKGLVLYRHESVFTAADNARVAEPIDNIVETKTRSDNLIVDQAATMQPGEWRNLTDLTTWAGKDEGVSFNSLTKVDLTDPNESYPVSGMGWTQTLVYNDGAIMLMLMRSTGRDVAFLHMDPSGHFTKTVWPEGVTSGGRRPYNRVTSDGEHFYFMTPSRDFSVPALQCTPLNNPGVFTGCAPNVGDDQIESMTALTYVPEWGRFYAYTPGGKLWTWAEGESAWTLLDRLRSHLSGYAGVVLWNPVKRELIVAGGQTFGNAEPLGHHLARLTKPMGKLEILPDMLLPSGSPLNYTSANTRMIANPRDGSYLMLKDQVAYTNDTAGGQYRAAFDLKSVGSPFGRYEMYAPYAFVPGTDVIVFLSHVRGLVLHRSR